VSFKLLVVLLSVAAAVAVGVFQLSTTYTVHALNVRTEVRADPPGIVRIIETGQVPSGELDSEGNPITYITSPTSPTSNFFSIFGSIVSGWFQNEETTSPGDSANITPLTSSEDKKDKKDKEDGGGGGGGGGGGATKPKVVNPKSNRPTVLSINTPIEFGTVFRGEELEGEFTIYIDSDNHTTLEPPGTPSTTWVKYQVYLGGTDNLTPYLTLVKKVDADTITDNVSPSYALLDTRLNDTSDTWLVKLDLSSDHPQYSALITGGDYLSVIHIDVIDYE